MSLIRTKESKRAIKDRKIRQRKGNPYNFLDETGQRFGRLEVIACAGRWKNTNEATWLLPTLTGKTRWYTSTVKWLLQ
jgi:hypothetical protein